MEERKLNTEGTEFKEPEVTGGRIGEEPMSVLDAMYKYNHDRWCTEVSLDRFCAELVSRMENDIAPIDPSETDEIIETGYGFLEEEENHLQHVSRDLWKGYVIGFMRGQEESQNRYDPCFNYYHEEYDGDDECVVWELDTNGSLCGLAELLEEQYNIKIRLANHADYIAYMKKHHPEELEAAQ